jgi:hypothetical protein
VTAKTLLKPWTAAERASLTELRAQKLGWDVIAERCGHSSNSCQSMHSRTITGRRRESKSSRRGWSAVDLAEMIRLHEEESEPWAAIDKRLKRPDNASKTKYYALRRAPAPPKPGSDAGAAEAAMRELAVRQSLMPASLTAFLCGDPLPGRSALDEKRAAAR